MPPEAELGGPERDPSRALDNGHLRLLRSSHIFSAVVREHLELRLIEATAPTHLSLSQFHLLKLMYLNGQHQMGRVADFLGVSAPAATKNIDKLEALGLVVRTHSTGDRRATLLSVSPAGRELVRRYEELKEKRLEPVLAGFAAEELEQLASLLERFSLSVLEADLHEGDGNGACLRCAAYVQEDCPVGQLRGGCPYHGSTTPRGRS